MLVINTGVASKEQAAKLVENLEKWLSKVKYGVPSLNPEDPRFDQLRYWRGPVWLIINWMISNGLRHYGFVLSNIFASLIEKTHHLINVCYHSCDCALYL